MGSREAAGPEDASGSRPPSPETPTRFCPQYHAESIANIREAVESFAASPVSYRPVAIALDTKGPEIRTGILQGVSGGRAGGSGRPRGRRGARAGPGGAALSSGSAPGPGLGGGAGEGLAGAGDRGPGVPDAGGRAHSVGGLPQHRQGRAGRGPHLHRRRAHLPDGQGNRCGRASRPGRGAGRTLPSGARIRPARPPPPQAGS